MVGLINRIPRGINVVLRGGLDFKKLTRKKLLIYDRMNINIFSDYFSSNFIEILCTRWEIINMHVLIMSIIHRRNYYEEYVDIVSPDVLLTLTDNNTKFMALTIPNHTVKVSIQNAHRTALGDIFYQLKDGGRSQYHVDYMFVFGKNIADELKKYIDGKTINLGSFRSNKTPILKRTKKNAVLVISTFRLDYLSNNKDMIGTSVTWNEYIKNEIKLMKWLFLYVDKLGLDITVLGAKEEYAKEEEEYYKKLSDGLLFDYYPNYKGRNTYQIIDEYEVTVSMDSTLGYEALSRGNKVAMFGGIRGEEYPLSSRKFGWPANYSDNGYFWTSSLMESEWKKIIDYVLNVSDDSWEKYSNKYIKDSIVYDEDNSEFISLMHELGIPLKTSDCGDIK